MFLKRLRHGGVRLALLPAELISVRGGVFTSDDLATQAALARSISRYGMLHPLVVRKKGRGYELISGERRLKAARLAGFSRVPCVIADAVDEECCAIRLAENLHRHVPDFLETAEWLRDFVYEHGHSIEEAAEYTGLTEREVTDKLRVLRLPQRTLFALRDSGLTERHALALLRIPQESVRDAALCEMAYAGMGPDAAERYVDRLLNVRPSDEVPGQRAVYIVKDVRMFLNSVSHGMDMMRGGGINAECIREDSDNCIKLTIRIPERTK